MSTQGEFFEMPSPVRQEQTEANSGNSDTDGALPDAKSFTPTTSKRGLKDLSIPKLYYSISEVSRITGLEQYVLRYWETEFDDLRPQKNRAGNRIYSNKDIKFILKIKELLREKRYTIEGAKQILKEELASEKELEKLEAQGAQASADTQAIADNPSQISIEDATLQQPLVKIERATIKQMRQSVKSLKEILRGK